MKLYSENKDYKLYQGNMLDMLEVIEPNAIDSIVTDPPYELNFMNKGWDNAGVSFNEDTWKKCFEVLKPGGYLLAFGGSRTYHRIACAIEDAGFEIRDTIMWLYGSGFPKSFNIGKQIEAKVLFNDASGRSQKKLKGQKINASMWTHHWSYKNGKEKNDYSVLSNEKVIDVEYTTELGKKWAGWGTQLKPSFEPIIVARKPVKGTIIDNVIEYGVGGINIDECRVETNEDIKTHNYTQNSGIYGEYSTNIPNHSTNQGRFPANTILTYDETDFDEVCGGFPNTKDSGGGPNYEKSNYTSYCDILSGNAYKRGIHYKESGSASRYFYCAKASKKDRDEGLDEFESVKCSMMASNANIDKNGNFTGMLAGRETKRKNTHPTVKPTELMQYLIRLVTPNNGTVLDPFNGSGSTGKAVMYENKERNKGYKYIGIELTEEYLPIAQARIEYVCNLKEEEKPQTTIFDYIGDSNE